MKLKLVAASLLILSASFVSAAFAAGGSVDANDLAAGTASVGSCDVPAGKWTPVFGPTGAATTTSVSVTNIATACDGKAVKLTVVGTGQTSLAERTGTVGGCTLAPNSCSVSFNDLSIATAAVAGVSMVVTG